MPVYIKEEFKKYNLNILTLKKWMQSVLEKLECSEKELSILLVDDKKICELNFQYRNIDQTTDVLSFPQSFSGGKDHIVPLLGDVVISKETAWYQAKRHHLSFEEEVILLLIHGTLHLLGFDHEISHKEAQRMKQKTHLLFKSIFPNTTLSKVGNY